MESTLHNLNSGPMNIANSLYLLQPLRQLQSGPQYQTCYDWALVFVVNSVDNNIGETVASCYNFQLKSLFVKSMLDELFLSMYTLNSC